MCIAARVSVRAPRGSHVTSEPAGDRGREDSIPQSPRSQTVEEERRYRSPLDTRTRGGARRSGRPVLTPRRTSDLPSIPSPPALASHGSSSLSTLPDCSPNRAPVSPSFSSSRGLSVRIDSELHSESTSAHSSSRQSNTNPITSNNPNLNSLPLRELNPNALPLPLPNPPNPLPLPPPNLPVGLPLNHIPNVAPEPDMLTWNLELLEQVLSRPCNAVLKSIPAGLRRQVATCLSDLMRDVVNYPHDDKMYTRLFLFPRAVLRVAPWEIMRKLRRRLRWREQRIFTLKCLNSWLAGGEQRDQLIRTILDEDDTPRLSKHGSDRENSNLKRCERIAREDGQFRKALKSLGSQGIAMVNENALETLKVLHPVGPEVNIRMVFPDAIEINKGAIKEALQSFPKGTSSGRSGMGIIHLTECCSEQAGVPACLDHLTDLVNLFLTGKALPSFASFMSSANLIPLLKKDGTSIRPIAIGEVLRRLISKCCVKRASVAAAQYLHPMQLGVKVKNGAEAILHSFNRYIRDPTLCDDNTVLSLIDFTNAFNRINRNSLLQEVYDHFPGMYGWIQYCYGGVRSKLFVGHNIIHASAGVQQGDPLGPLLFALVLHPLLTRLRQDFAVTVGAYLDDLTIAGSADQVSQAIQYIRREGPSHGLSMSMSKSIVWSPSGRDLSNSDLFAGMTCSRDNGVELLGGAISTSQDFYKSVIDKRVDKCVDTMHKMMQLRDPQLCLMLLRACEGMPKLVYSWRTTPPEFLEDAAIRFDHVILLALRWIIVGDGPSFGSFHQRLATLPVSMGGLGVLLPTDIRRFAFCASALSSLNIQQAILGAPAISSAQDIPQSVQDCLLSAGHHIAGPNAIAFNQEVIQKSFDPHAAAPPFNTQLFMARAYFESKKSNLLNDPYITSKSLAVRRKFKGIIDSNSVEGTSAWLFALPNGGLKQEMSTLEFQAAVSLRLLIPQFSPGSKCCQRTCTAYMDIYGYHALNCRGHFLTRHNTVRDALFDLMIYGRFNPVKDADVMCLGHRSDRPTALRPADLLIAGDGYFDRNCVDVTIVSPIVTNNQPNIKVGDAAQRAEQAKYDKHAQACDTAGYGFNAFAMDVFGVRGKQSNILLERVIEKMSRETCCPKYKSQAICHRRISMALQLGVSRQLLASRRVVDAPD